MGILHDTRKLDYKHKFLACIFLVPGCRHSSTTLQNICSSPGRVWSTSMGGCLKSFEIRTIEKILMRAT